MPARARVVCHIFRWYHAERGNPTSVVHHWAANVSAGIRPDRRGAPRVPRFVEAAFMSPMLTRAA